MAISTISERRKLIRYNGRGKKKKKKKKYNYMGEHLRLECYSWVVGKVLTFKKRHALYKTHKKKGGGGGVGRKVVCL